MTGRVRGISAHRRTAFEAGWTLRATPAGEIETPAQLADTALPAWLPIDAPDTVAGTLRSAGLWSIDGPPRRFDADDWWFRAIFDAPSPSRQQSLCFGGLAGECSLWLNGELLLVSDNMHVAHDCAMPPLRDRGNELLMRFTSLDARLATWRPRPRWRAPMIEHQQLRHARVSLLGRTPGWSPPAPAIGPWRAIEWIDRDAVTISDLRIRSDVDSCIGQVALTVDITPLGEAGEIEIVMLRVWRDSISHDVAAVRSGVTYSAILAILDPEMWWPHTHGEPALYEAALDIRLAGLAGPVTVDLGSIGFRMLTVETVGGDFALKVNGVPIFCRGANWTPLDVASPAGSTRDTRAALEQIQAAGLNMLRVNGCMVYEDDAFFEACDALGLLVWQDFMFANMDYPADDMAFLASVQEEARQQLARWQAHPSLAIICGNSEAEQQAAMWGAPREAWTQPLFSVDLAALADALCSGAVGWPSSAHGGAFPHQTNVGTTSYYGVGAYLRPLDDARRAGLRFASECLAFANVPSSAAIARMPGGTVLRPHHPAWKARVPRDAGAGWDFEDVRDWYLAHLYRVDPVALRSTDPDRYLELARAVSAEVIEATFAEWRRPGTGCRGALVWFLRDLQPGPGWGLLDERGAPKAAFHGLRRAAAPIRLFITDEGTSGPAVHVVNDPATPLAARIEVALWRDDGARLQSNSRDINVSGHDSGTWAMGEWFDGFIDVSRAFRFGPPEHALVVATLHDAAGHALDRSFFFPEGLSADRCRDVGLTIPAIELPPNGDILATITTRQFAQSVHFEATGYRAEDDWFHLAPGETRAVRLVRAPEDGPPARHIGASALNARAGAIIAVPR